MTDLGLATKIFFGIAGACVVLIVIVFLVQRTDWRAVGKSTGMVATATPRILWSIVVSIAKAFGSAIFAIVDILMYTYIIGVIVGLIVIPLIILLAVFRLVDRPSLIWLTSIFPWIGLGYLYRKIKKMEEGQSLRRDDQPNHLDQPPDHSPH